MRLHKVIGAACIALLPCLSFAVPLELVWQPVTTNTDGSPSGPISYRVYKKTSLEDFKPVWDTKNTRFTWLVPSLGRYTFRVTAINQHGAESAPSNELKVIVERVGREDK